MCGIAGTYATSTAASREFLLAMAGELRHRGPDGVGLYLDGRFGMVNTRLAILDLSGGDQPLADEAGRYWAMQNGEIYNHLELRRELEALGHRFATHSDTEVLAHAYEAWGSACLGKLNGDFALAIWDREAQELFLARDRFGVRPLFLTRFGGDLSFASEAKALLRHRAARRQLDPLGLVESLTLWSILPDRSAFDGIVELPPAHFLRYGPAGLVEQRRWWDLSFDAADHDRQADEGALAEELRSLLEDATRLRLRADVPVGTYLSGGLDSSAITALATRILPRPPRSFAVGFRDQRFDECQHQERMARALGIELRRVEIDEPDIAGAFPEVVRLSERPLLRTAPAPLLHLSRLVHAQGFKVVLTGEGADELFAGYDIFKEARIRRLWARQPDSTLRPRLLQRLYPYLGRDTAKAAPFLRLFFGQGLTDTDDPLYSHQIRFGNARRSLRFLRPEVLERAAAAGDPRQRLASALPDAFAHFDDLGKAQYLEIRTFLSGYLLAAQGDRMLMGNAVEGRFPFLDHRLAEFAARLPPRLRLRGLEEKHLLRRAVAPLLPADIGRRPKRAYRAPILRTFLGPGAPGYVAELLAPGALEAAGLFQPRAVARLLDKGRQAVAEGFGETDEMALVAVISTMLLVEQLVARPALAPPAVPTKVVAAAHA